MRVRIRDDLVLCIEQPASSWAFKLPTMRKLAKQWGLSLGCNIFSCLIRVVSTDLSSAYRRSRWSTAPRKITLTYMGLFGHDLEKPSHLLNNFRTRTSSNFHVDVLTQDDKSIQSQQKSSKAIESQIMLLQENEPRRPEDEPTAAGHAQGGPAPVTGQYSTCMYLNTFHFIDYWLLLAMWPLECNPGWFGVIWVAPITCHNHKRSSALEIVKCFLSFTSFVALARPDSSAVKPGDKWRRQGLHMFALL